jgi:hypothetical protein
MKAAGDYPSGSVFKGERLDRAVSVAIVIVVLMVLMALVWWGSTPA